MKCVAVISVLYIDNDQVILDSCRHYLEREPDIHIDFVPSAKEAFHLLKTVSFDVIISDYEMPEINGIQFLKIIREKFPRQPFIFFTAKDREEILIDAISNGADDYVKKGGDPTSQFAELAYKIKRAVALRESEKKIARLNRTDSVYRRFNEAVTHIHDRARFLQNVCDIMVKEGGFVMTWVGFEDSETHMINSVIAAGTIDDFFVEVRTESDGNSNRLMPIVTAIRLGKYIIWNDIKALPDKEFWQENALRKGYKSAASFPIITGKNLHGAITFYSRDVQFFTVGEIQILNTISENISSVLTELERDETRGQFQEEMAHTEYRLSEIIDFLPVATFAIDINDTITLWNKTMETLTHISAEQVLGLGNYEYSFHMFGERIPGLLDLVFAPDAELEKYHYSEIQRNGNTIRAQLPLNSPEGKPFILEIVASPLYDQQGELSGAIESVYNNTEKSRHDEKFYRIFEMSEYGILILDSDSKQITEVNPFASNLTGYSRKFLIGKNIEETGLFEDPFRVDQFFADLTKTGFIRYKNIHLKSRSGKKINIELISRIISLQDQSFIQCSLYDIFDQQRNEESRILAGKNLNLLSGMIRHDILNQLMVVSGSLELASYSIQEPDLVKHINRAQTATKTIQRQIIFTREYENLGAGVPSWQSISPVIQRAFLEVQTDTVSLNIQEDNFEIFADPLLDKAFFLLFNYAYKYGDKVTKIDIYYLYTGERLIISIADNGSGISPENKIHLFDWKAGNEKTHGLYLVQKILSGTGITISETGEFKKGTRFEIIVPTDAFRTGFNPPQQKN